METNKLKKFASEARTILKRGVAAKMRLMGFDANGHIDESEMPVLIQGGTIFRGQQYSEGFYRQWMSLYKRIKEKGVREVYEEAAYTWFNRFMAIRILQKNGLAEPVLDFVDVARTPQIVDAARMGHHPQMSAADEEQLRLLLSDVSAVTPQFSLLITAYCHNNPIIYKCFGGIADYTELLLPNDILAENGFVDTLNHTEFITDEDFASPELIGWLYQFYISERKDEVFAKKGKLEADEIPAATQIFTPNWIVKYMVQNTVGRIYLDNNPWATDLKDKWKYLVEPSEPTPEEAKLKYNDLTELRVGDLACGSGHILNECFDLLFDLYIEDGYSRSEAIEAIFKQNLTGIDLDTRARQLATFALLLKACQCDHSFADAHVMPNILDMPVPQKDEEALATTLHNFFKGSESKQDITVLLDAFKLMRNADSLGSIMIFDIPDSTRVLINHTVEYYVSRPEQADEFDEIIPAMKLILVLTEKYHSLVMNPPYMGAKSMNEKLSDYVKFNYDEGKQDLATVFVQMMPQRLLHNGKYSFIIPPSWMTQSTFSSIRQSIICSQKIDSFLYLSRGIFGADFGSSSAVISNYYNRDSKGEYFKLIDRTFQEFDQKHLRMLFEESLKNSDFKYRFFEYDKSIDKPTYSEDGEKIKFSNVIQVNFRRVDGMPIAFWLSDNSINILAESSTIYDVASPRQGFATGDNKKFLRYVWEISKLKRGRIKWVPCSKGGTFRKWYGNIEYCVNWENDGKEMKDFPGSVIRNEKYYFSSIGCTWSTISSGKPAFRLFDKNYLFESKGSVCFPFCVVIKGLKNVNLD